MSVVEVAQALGSWNLKLREDTPIELLDKLDYFGHIAISAARVDPVLAGDALLDDARYVGILRDRGFGEENKTIAGVGMAAWLGDEDDKGQVLETTVTFTNSTFTNAITTVLPSAVHAGNISSLSGLHNGTYIFQSPRKVIDYICSLYNAEYRVRGSGLIDVGLVSDLYVTSPKVAVLRNRSGKELNYRALRGSSNLDSDVKDFTTRVLLLAEGTEASTVSATADINPALNPYRDLFGNPVKRTRVVSEQQTASGNAAARAQLQLNRFTSPRDALKLSTDQYDIPGDARAGDYIWVYDPDAKLIDEANPIDFYGQEIYPLKLRCFQLNWPVVEGMGVSFRTYLNEWIDLTDYVIFETGTTEITVGGYNRSLTGVGSGPVQDPGSRPIENTTIPGKPVWTSPFAQTTYTGDDGLSHAQVVLTWTQPLNTDGSVIDDPGYYEIRWRTSNTSVYPVTHTDLAQYRHNQLTGSWASPIPYAVGPWQYTQAPWDDLQFLMLDLTPGIPYDFQIRALDNGTPPNTSEWSDNVVVQTRPDTTAPSTPAAPATVAGSRNAIQIVHTLGKSSGGVFNLEADLNHFQIHTSTDPNFLYDVRTVKDGGTLLGKLPANQGMLRGKIPAVGTFQLDNDPNVTRYIRVVAVDNYGNESTQSDVVQQTAVLIDSAFISELTVSKVSAGTITATWLLASEIMTGTQGARVVIAWYGIEVFNQNNIKTLDIDSSTGEISILGTFTASNATASVQVTPGGGVLPTPGVFLLADNSSKPAIIFSTPDGSTSLPSSLCLRGSLNNSDDAGMVILRDDYANIAFYSKNAAIPGFPNGVYQTAGGSVVAQSGSARIGMETAGVPGGGFFLAGPTDAKMAVNNGGADKNVLYFDPAGHIRAFAGPPGAVQGYMEITADSSNVFYQLRDFAGNSGWGYAYYGALGISRQSCSVEADVVSQNLGTPAYRPIRASAFPIGSSVEIKKDFEAMPDPALDILRQSGGPLRYAYDGDRPEEVKHLGLLAEMLPEWLLTPRKSEEEMGDSGLPNSETIDVVTLASLAIAGLLELDAEVDELRAELGKPKRARHSNKKLVADAKAGKIKRKK